ncbi:hypothetical protein ACIPC1_39535 [Streptomyces sp. NPDC087263]|uniref:hypothetical protein n=1 Tax=Streptomyces sp. NPDC087263 TaxID=3365773 RepID=UPI003827E5E5
MSEPTAADGPAVETEVPVTCKFTGCSNRPEPKDPSKPGPAPEYCAREDHNAGTKWRLDQQAKRAAKRAAGSAGAPEIEAVESDKPVTDSAADAVNVRETVIAKVDQLRAELERYITLLQTVNDPEAAEAQMLAVESEAQTRIATADQRADAERSRRVTAENVARAAEEAKAAADEAAEQLMNELEEAQAQFQSETARIREDAAAQIEAAQNEAAMAVETAKHDANSKVERITQDAAQAREQLLAETAMKVAEFKQQADERVDVAETAAGRAQTEATSKVEAMEKTVADEKAAAEAVKTQAEEAVKAAQAKETAAEERVRTAEASVLQAERDAETRVSVEQERRTALETAHAAELGRAIERQGVLEGQVAALHTTVNDTKDQMREVQTKLTLAQAEVERLTTSGGK